MSFNNEQTAAAPGLAGSAADQLPPLQRQRQQHDVINPREEGHGMNLFGGSGGGDTSSSTTSGEGEGSLSSTQAVEGDGEAGRREKEEDVGMTSSSPDGGEEHYGSGPAAAAVVAQKLSEVDLPSPPEDKVKREEMQRACAFENERKQFFSEQVDSHTACFNALRGVVGQSAHSLNDVIVYLEAHLENRTQAATEGMKQIEKARDKRQNAEKTKKHHHPHHHHPHGGIDLGACLPSSADDETVTPSVQSSSYSDGGYGGGGVEAARDVDSERVLHELEELDIRAHQMDLTICNEIKEEVLEPSKEVFTRTEKDGDHVVKEGYRTLMSLMSINNFVANRYTEMEKTVAEDTPRKEGDDQWLSALRYYQMAEQQRITWPTVCQQMVSLVTLTRDVVLRRKQAVKDAVNNLLRKHDVGGKSSLHLQDSVKNALNSLQLKDDLVQEDIKRQIAVATVRMQTANDSHRRHHHHHDKGEQAESVISPKPDMSRAGAVLEGLGHPAEPPSMSSFGHSDITAMATSCPLILKVEMVEFKEEGVVSKIGGGIGGTWHRALAVVTHDHYLHIFSLPKGSSKLTNSAEALVGFMPSPLPTTSGPLTKDQQAEGSITATVSLDLRVNDVSSRPKAKKPEHQRQFVLTGLQKNTGIKSVFKAESRDTVKLRAETPEKMMEWVLLCMAIAKAKEAHGMPDLSAGGVAAAGPSEADNASDASYSDDEEDNEETGLGMGGDKIGAGESATNRQAGPTGAAPLMGMGGTSTSEQMGSHPQQVDSRVETTEGPATALLFKKLQQDGGGEAGSTSICQAAVPPAPPS